MLHSYNFLFKLMPLWSLNRFWWLGHISRYCIYSFRSFKAIKNFFDIYLFIFVEKFWPFLWNDTILGGGRNFALFWNDTIFLGELWPFYKMVPFLLGEFWPFSEMVCWGILTLFWNGTIFIYSTVPEKM